MESAAELKKDPGIPNLWPHKEKLLRQLADQRDALEKEKEREKERMRARSKVDFALSFFLVLSVPQK